MPFASIVLFVNVSVVALPTSVSVAAGKVTVTSAVAAGPIRVTEFVPLSVSSLNNIEPAAEDEPVKIGDVKLLFVNVWLPAKVATVESIAKVTALPLPLVSIPVPPVKVNVSLSKSIAKAPPLSA